MFEKLLIANRGEIALRIQRACREMGISTVAVHSTADADAMHVRLADESVCIGPPPAQESYLNAHAILTAATISNADAIHPGYGFLAENADFATMAEEHGFTFVGPRPEHIRRMGDKIEAKKTVQEAGIPVVPGSDGVVTGPDGALEAAAAIGYPVMIKASAGGGGRGMRMVAAADEMRDAYSAASHEAQTAFGSGAMYVEKYLANPRHVEVQILADQHGTVVHLGERDCSLQRRHQKLVEEAPSPALNLDQRNEIGRIATEAARQIGYRSVGTFEFLFQDGEFYFIEMNTRLQVEHAVTEMICGLDLVREMVRIADGTPLDFGQDDIRFFGHAIECRVTAEDPETLQPAPGTVSMYHAPGGLGVRVDSALYSGYRVPPYYDSMVAKLIVHGANRNECLMRLRRALDEFVIDGLTTTIPMYRRLVGAADFINGDYDIHWMEKFAAGAATEPTS